MAISTLNTELRWAATAEDVAKKVCIKDFPDMIGEPNTIEITCLSDAQETSIPGITTSELLTFTCNYTKADFQTCQADANKPMYYALVFSDGSKFTWQGQHTLGLPGKGVDEVVEFTVNIAAATAVVFDAGV